MLSIVILISGQLVQVINGLELSDLQFGFTLKSSSYLVKENMGVLMCAKTCGLSTDCRSFNYDAAHLRCILNYVTSGQESSSLFQQQAGFVYGDSSAIEGDSELMGACQNHSCPEHTTCVLLSTGNKHCIISECGPPPTVSGTDTVSFPFPIASDFIYKCTSGNTPPGLQIMCLSSGKWTENKIECLDQCPVPPKLTNATVVGIGRYVGDSKTYQCQEGTTVHGEVVITCLEGGVWSNTSLVCEPDCTDAISEAGASLVGSNLTTFGGFVTYECQNGYDLISGNGRMYCGPGGEWLPMNISCSAPQN